MDEDLPSGWIKETRIKMIGKKVVKRNPVNKNSVMNPKAFTWGSIVVYINVMYAFHNYLNS